MLRSVFQRVVTAAAFTVVTMGQAQAALFTLDGQGSWLEFMVSDGIRTWQDASGGPAVFQFTSDVAFALRVTDFNFPGDVVSVYANDELLGNTSDVAFDIGAYADTPGDGWADARWSKGQWLLPAGTYVFRGMPEYVSVGIASFGISTMAAVPEPGMLALAVLGLGVVCAARRQRSVRTTV